MTATAIKPITLEEFLVLSETKPASEFINKQTVIANRFERFIKDYKKWTSDPSYYRAEKIIAFSALQYFHKELGLNN